MPDPQRVNVSELLPQQPPFVMVDCLLSFDNDTTVCGYRVPEDGVFSDNGRLCAAGLVENVAQTCAARLGVPFSWALSVPFATSALPVCPALANNS